MVKPTITVAEPRGNLMKLGMVSFIKHGGGTLRVNQILATDGHNLFLIKNGQNPAVAAKGGAARDLYKRFHGAEPRNARHVTIEEPKGQLVSMGEVSQINYRPQAPSQHTGTEFYHKSGDTGERTLKSNLILAKDAGQNYFLIKQNPGSRYPYVNERGIIG